MVHGEASDTEVSAQVRTWLPGIDPDDVAVAVVRETIDGVDYVTVRASYEFRLVTGLLPGSLFTLAGSARTPLAD